MTLSAFFAATILSLKVKTSKVKTSKLTSRKGDKAKAAAAVPVEGSLPDRAAVYAYVRHRQRDTALFCVPRSAELSSADSPASSPTSSSPASSPLSSLPASGASSPPLLDLLPRTTSRPLPLRSSSLGAAAPPRLSPLEAIARGYVDNVKTTGASGSTSASTSASATTSASSSPLVPPAVLLPAGAFGGSDTSLAPRSSRPSLQAHLASLAASAAQSYTIGVPEALFDGCSDSDSEYSDQFEYAEYLSDSDSASLSPSPASTPSPVPSSDEERVQEAYRRHLAAARHRLWTGQGTNSHPSNRIDTRPGELAADWVAPTGFVARHPWL